MNAIPSIPLMTVPPVIEESLPSEERESLKARIRELLKQQNAVLIAHYYTSVDLQELAEETGGCVSDSLEMARFGHAHSATTLVVAGVRFMGETAKLLNPEKRVLMPIRLGRLKYAFKRGWRMSQSAMITRLPFCAMTTARFEIVVDFPSPGSALVIRIFFNG